MGKRAARCVCSAMAALLMATTVFVVPAAADVGGSRDASEDVRVVRVAFPEVEGISETDADGVRSGILYDWLAEVSKYTGWTYEFVDGDVQSLMKRTSAGEIDLMGGMYYREQLVDSFQYSNFAIGANHALLISLEENDDVVVFDSRTLNGKTIGVFENATEKIRRLENYLDFNDIHCIVLPLDYDAYSKCLDDGTADVVLGGDVDVTEGRRVAAEFDGVLRPIRFGIAKKRVKVRRSVRRVGRNLLDARLDQLAVLDLAARLDVDSVQLAHTGENKGLGAVELLRSGV